MVCFLPYAIREPQTVEDLKTAALEAICLASEDLAVSFIDDTGLDPAMCHPGCCHEPKKVFGQCLQNNPCSFHSMMSAL